MSIRGKTSIFAVILLTGLVLRLWGIGFGLPYLFHQDEPIVVNHAMAYGAGDLNPHFFAIPPLTSYLLFIVYAFLFLAGKLFGAWPDAGAFAVSFFTDPGPFYLAGRIFIGVIPGILCVSSTWFFARKFISEKGALFAAAIMSLSFLNVVNSHYIYTDMLLTLCVILAISRFFELYNDPSMLNYVLAGALCGLAAGIKYNGILLALPFVLAHFLGQAARGGRISRQIFSAKLWTGVVVSPAVFLLTNPFMIIDFQGFYSSVKTQSGAFWPTGWGHHFFYSIVEGISLPVALAAVSGLVLLALRKGKGLVLVSFPVLYYIVIVHKSQHFARYVLPLIPFFAVGAGYLLFNIIYPRFKDRLWKGLIAGLSVILLMPTFIKSVKADMLFSSTDTRVSASAWIKNNLPEGSRIACDSTNFRPALRQPYSQLEIKKAFLGSQSGLGPLKAKKLSFQMRALRQLDVPDYPVYFLFEEPAEEGQFLNTIPALPFDKDALYEEGIDYVAVNEQLVFPAKTGFIEDIEDDAEIIMVFSPYYDGRYRATSDATATTCIPVKSDELFKRRSAGPALKLYRLK